MTENFKDSDLSLDVVSTTNQFLKLIKNDLDQAKRFAENNDFLCVILGDYYLKNNDFNESKFWLEKSIEINPNNHSSYDLLGSVFFKQKKFDEAYSYYEKSLAINPNSSHALCDMGVIEKIRGNYEKAWENYNKVLEKEPDGEVINTNMGVLYCEQGDFLKGKEHYEKALKNNNFNEKILFNCSLVQLMLGDYKNGFRNYEKRPWTTEKPPGKQWSGEKNQKIMILSEQGYGDIIQFSRFLSLAKQISEKISFLCPESLVNLMTSVEGADEVLEFNANDSFVEIQKESDADTTETTHPYNYYSRLLSLPFILNLDKKDIPNEKYLRADKEKINKYKKIIKSDKFKVGLVWQGSTRTHDPELSVIRKKANLVIDQLSTILSNKNVSFYSLQKNEETNEKNNLENYNIIDLQSELKDFSETAAIIENLDLVISVDTSTAHLAGALRKPVWLLSRKSGCWRWMNEGNESIWYPSMKIYRQTEYNNWDSTIKEISEDLLKIT